MIQDRSTRSRVLTAIRDAEQYRHLLKNGITYGILVLDAQGQVMTWGSSAEHLFGYHKAEMLGKHFSRLFFRSEEIERGEPERELGTAANDGCACGDRWYVRKDGTALWCSGITVSMPDSTGGERVFVKLLRDLTPSKLSKATATASEEVADVFDQLLAVITGRGVSMSGMCAAQTLNTPAVFPQTQTVLRMVQSECLN
jgi:PAS domain S-box-containing protein